jgi:hypothetical protein
MKDFAKLIGGEQGAGKSLAEIRATTGKVERPDNWRYNQKLPEWERAETQLSRDAFIRACEPRNDKILVQILPIEEKCIILTDKKTLIGGECRKAIVLKLGPGRWIPGEHYWSKDGEPINGVQPYGWNWFPGYRRPVSFLAGQTVLIGRWTDLEIEDIALCSELDVRAIVA